MNNNSFRSTPNMPYQIRVDHIHGKDNYKAMVSVSIGPFLLHGIRLYRNQKGVYYLGMPCRASVGIDGQEVYNDIFHPVSREAREKLVRDVQEAYEQCLAQNQEEQQPENRTEAAQEDTNADPFEAGEENGVENRAFAFSI